MKNIIILAIFGIFSLLVSQVEFVDIDAGLQGVEHSSVEWGDYDNDGDLDILLTGAEYRGDFETFSRIYNNDNGSFTDIEAGFHDSKGGAVAWGDYDNDEDK
ncbi:MAG: VCBS repeat-containing protein [Candidatus Delongbacteria bacterium]|nr:VCBS repeat-containing protein [Candidatus Delongbacteria bacterium]MCG2761280.1 VCBS repeat-containing protein [Candidatus Delongbacteria bacterium]